MKIPFLKVQGTGNDFILVDCRKERLSSPFLFARRFCQRKSGIGADGLLLLLPATMRGARFRMRVFNADGGEAEMCGNGIRCIGAYLEELGLFSDGEPIETLAGPVPLFLREELFEACMGKPSFIRSEDGKEAVLIPVKVNGRNFRATFLSTGNPHAVLFAEGKGMAAPLMGNPAFDAVGRALQSHSLCPKGTNVELVEILSSSHLRVRVWERGIGETASCGTGAVASLAASHRSFPDLVARECSIEMAGGVLHVRWDEEGMLFLRGPAEIVFSGEVEYIL